MTEHIFELADLLREAKDHKKDLDTEIKSVNAEIDRLELELTDAMADQEVERFSRNGHTFYINSRTFASPAGGKRDEMITALKDNGYGDIVTETVNANTLSSFVKEQTALNDGVTPAWLNDVVTIYERISVGIRKG